MESEEIVAITVGEVAIRFKSFKESLNSNLLTADDIIYNGFEHFYHACSPTKLHIICDRLSLEEPVTIDDGTRESTREVWNLLLAVSKPAEEVAAVNRGNRPSVRGEHDRPAGSSQKGRSVKYEDNMIITVKIGENPKKGTAKARFALYKTGMTVKEYLDLGGKRPDISWDAKQGWIEVNPTQEATAGDGGSSL